MGSVAMLPALALLAGVAIGATSALPSVVPLGLAAALAAWLVAVWQFTRTRTLASVLSLVLGFVAAGTSLGAEAAVAAWSPRGLEPWYTDTDDATSDRPAVLEGRILTDAKPTRYGVAFMLDVGAVESAGRRWHARGGVRVSVGGSLVGDTYRDWRAGRRVRVSVTLNRPAAHRNFGTTDQELAAARRGVRLYASAKSALLVELLENGPWARELAAATRDHVRRVIATSVGVYDRTSGAVVVAMLMGDRSGLDGEVQLRLQRAGTFHVLAISGAHVGLLAALLFCLPRRFGVAERATAAAVILCLTAYAASVEAGSSVTRATMMAVAYLAARLLDHRTSPMNALAVAAAVHLAVTPLALFDVGFALSFGATIGIVQMVRLVREARSGSADGGDTPDARPADGPAPKVWLARGARALGWIVAATVAAEVALMPLSAMVFARATVAGLGLNLIAMPLMSVVQVAGFATAGLGTLADRFGLLTGYLAHLAAQGIVESGRLVDRFPALVLDVPPPSWTVVAVYYLGLLVAITWPAWRRRGPGMAVSLAAGVWMLTGGLPDPRPKPWTWIDTRAIAHVDPAADRWLSVTFLDVGQGDATLVQLPDGHALLVDAGGASPGGDFDVGERVVSRALWALGLRRVDRLGITHADLDHVGGALAVAERFRPRSYWEGVPAPGHAGMAALARLAEEDGARWRRVQRGEVVTRGGATVDVLHPDDVEWERPEVRNNDSIVLDVRFGDVSFVLPGDVYQDVERDVRSHVRPARLRVLKAAHHGSATSTSAELLDALEPAAVIVSCGWGNRYGHPAPQVLSRLHDAGAMLLRTDRDGAIQLATNGRVLIGRTMSGKAFVIEPPR